MAVEVKNLPDWVVDVDDNAFTLLPGLYALQELFDARSFAWDTDTTEETPGRLTISDNWDNETTIIVPGGDEGVYNTETRLASTSSWVFYGELWEPFAFFSASWGETNVNLEMLLTLTRLASPKSDVLVEEVAP